MQNPAAKTLEIENRAPIAPKIARHSPLPRTATVRLRHRTDIPVARRRRRGAKGLLLPRAETADVEQGAEGGCAARDPAGRMRSGWGGRIRTCAWRYQKPLPYRLATPQIAGRLYSERADAAQERRAGGRAAAAFSVPPAAHPQPKQNRCKDRVAEADGR